MVHQLKIYKLLDNYVGIPEKINDEIPEKIVPKKINNEKVENNFTKPLFDIINTLIPEPSSTPQPKTTITTNITTHLILDVSGSMGGQVNRLLNDILPDIFDLLGYESSDIIRCYFFSNESYERTYPLHELRVLKKEGRGHTYISGAISQLFNNILKSDGLYHRIITISDGEISDSSNCTSILEKIPTEIYEKHILSYVIRFKTSNSEPETRALAGILQLNTDKNISLLNTSYLYSDYDIKNSIINMFENDKLGCNVLKIPGIKLHPYSSKVTNIISLQPYIFLNKIPEIVYIDDSFMEIVNCVDEELPDKYLDLIVEKYMNKLKLLKVINNSASNDEIRLIIEYFNKLQSTIELKYESKMTIISEVTDLSARLNYIKNLAIRRQKSFIIKMKEIANDNNVSKFNALQQAEYLRNAQVTNTGKNLAKRALKDIETSGLSFDETLRYEVLMMKQNLYLINDIDDSTHARSFYSLSTTLDGIKSVCSLADSIETFQYISANDILKLINIVGFACDGAIGDYPDPMTYRLKDIYPECSVSLSDVISICDLGYLRTYGTNKKIVNVVPFFDDLRILKFLKKYAPNLLEYNASIGMRRLIAKINTTFFYTICAGILALIEDLNKRSFEIHKNSFKKLIETYEVAIDGHFSHVHKYFDDEHERSEREHEQSEREREQSEREHEQSEREREQSEREHERSDDDISSCSTAKSDKLIRKKHKIKSYYIANNGLSNMIEPFIWAFRNNKINDKIIQKILRAIYTYEIWQVVKRSVKFCSDKNYITNREEPEIRTILGLEPGVFIENPKEVTSKLLDILLNIDLTKNQRVSELFEKNEIITPNPELIINERLLNYFKNQRSDIKYIASVPYIISESLGIPPDTTFAKPGCNECDIEKALGISYPFNTFLTYCIFQSLKYFSKQSRISSEYEEMLISDQKYLCVGEKYMKLYISNKYKIDYDNQLSIKVGEELKQISNKLVHQLSVSYFNTFLNLLQNGIQIGTIEYAIKSTNSIGFKELLNTLLEIPNKDQNTLDKIWVLLIGVNPNNDTIVFNQGNVYRTNLQELSTKLPPDFFSKFTSVYASKGHMYRSFPNRHSHGNEKPSYWALGYSSIHEMKSVVSNVEWVDYIKIHTNCCGLATNIK